MTTKIATSAQIEKMELDALEQRIAHSRKAAAIAAARDENLSLRRELAAVRKHHKREMARMHDRMVTLIVALGAISFLLLAYVAAYHTVIGW